MPEPAAHIVPYMFRKQQAVICADLVIKRGRVLKLKLLIPFFGTRAFALERINPAHVKVDLGEIKAHGLISYILTVIHARREIEG